MDGRPCSRPWDCLRRYFRRRFRSAMLCAWPLMSKMIWLDSAARVYHLNQTRIPFNNAKFGSWVSLNGTPYEITGEASIRIPFGNRSASTSSQKDCDIAVLSECIRNGERGNTTSSYPPQKSGFQFCAVLPCHRRPRRAPRKTMTSNSGGSRCWGH